MISLLGMASSNIFFNDMHVNPEVIDITKNEDMAGTNDYVNDSIQCSPKSQLSIANSVRELLGCPVCLNAMYPPIYQVCLVHVISFSILFLVFCAVFLQVGISLWHAT